MPELKPYEGNEDVYLWKYVPSAAAGGVFAGCFGVLTLLTAWRIISTRTWFSISLLIGGCLEAIGYATRIYCTYNTDQLAPYAVQTILILVAPALLAASVYMVLGRVIRSLDAQHLSAIRVRWLTRVFVLADVCSFLLQGSGGSLQTNQDLDPDIGKAVVLVGLFAQVAAFGLFIAAAVLFHVRVLRNPTAKSLRLAAGWGRTMRMLYCVNSLIMARSIFRIIEYMMGIDSYLFEHEWPLYAFDGVLMLWAMVFYVWWYPGDLSQQASDVELSSLEPPRHEGWRPPLQHENRGSVNPGSGYWK